jgi:hypothetical protein
MDIFPNVKVVVLEDIYHVSDISWINYYDFDVIIYQNPFTILNTINKKSRVKIVDKIPVMDITLNFEKCRCS